MRKAFVLAAVLALSFAPAPLPKKSARPTSPGLEGKWEVIYWRMSVRHNAGVGEDGREVRIVSGRLDQRLEADFQPVWHLAFVPGERPPGVGLTDVRSGQTTPGIYRLEGDTLTICYPKPGGKRPEEFHDRQQWMLVLKRMRP